MNGPRTIERTTSERFRCEISQPSPTLEERVAVAAQKHLLESGHRPLRGVSCQYHDGMFVLRGKVPSFYMKQLAQEIVRKIEGVGEVANSLEVFNHAVETFQEVNDAGN